MRGRNGDTELKHWKTNLVQGDYERRLPVPQQSERLQSLGFQPMLKGTNDRINFSISSVGKR